MAKPALFHPQASRKSRTAAALILAALFVSAGFAQTPGQAAAAAPIVKNGKRPAPPAGAAAGLKLEPLWTIGGGDTPDQDFSDITAIAVRDDGAVYILDGKECLVKAYDAQAKLLRSFGKKGQGPGEMGAPISLHVTPAGELLVEDATNRKLSYFDKDGKFLRQVSTAQGMGMGLAGLVMDRRGRMAGRSLSFEGGKIGFEVKVFDKDLKPGATLSKIELALLGNMKFDPLSMAPGLVMAADDMGRLFLGSSKGYRIQTFDFEGKPLRTLERDYDPVPVKKEDQERIFKIIGNLPSTGGLSIREMILIPEVFPAYSTFVVDPDGRLLVRSYEKGKTDKEYFYDLFDADGRYTARFPTSSEFLQWRNGRLYGVQENEDGFKVLTCYRVIG